MITLDPEFLGGFAPQSKLTEGIDFDALPFARQPRLNRLRIQRKADKTEDTSESETTVERLEDTSDRGREIVRRERHKMRGKGKSIKRCVGNCSSVTAWVYMGLGQILAETKKKCHRPKSRELNSSCFILPEGHRCQVALREALAQQRTRARSAADDKSRSGQPSALNRFYHR
jgi:hypothetical protein